MMIQFSSGKFLWTPSQMMFFHPKNAVFSNHFDDGYEYQLESVSTCLGVNLKR